MNYRALGSSDMKVSEISFGTWAIGGSWGSKDDAESLRALETAIEAGVNFFDTADVYGEGHSEQLLAQATKGKEDDILIATKFCRAGDIREQATYSEASVRAYCEGSLRRLGRERIDLYQIHCPPLSILQDGSVFGVLDKLKEEGKIREYGVSVESVEEGLFCLGQPNVRSLQVIFNLFRQKPAERLLGEAKEKGVGILVRLPLASGLLTGKFAAASAATFEADDHRRFNENGEMFNVGETFAGLGFAKGVELAEQLRWIEVDRNNMTRASLRWLLDHEAITCVIPGFKNVAQVQDNLAALHVPPFSDDEMDRIRTFYKEHVHAHIRGSY
ncbi:aldo/keto reductase [Paenibacillus sp. LHD-117]|uniref:aldo/keto reductase n=1 Tax=Paenibacillus sp. LHD-117 TaxID=3071412 RepID=UPI0027E202A6|nr:aldo/keto reductase [Paenibacillus sp. LHD-117]MDQ6420154.1 aldo/keto reductase [Paenibacillus sp. LHD-117]